jgi:hypothetical protein
MSPCRVHDKNDYSRVQRRSMMGKRQRSYINAFAPVLLIQDFSEV